MTPFRAGPDYAGWPGVARLIRDSFAYMTPLLGHPARTMTITDDALRAAARDGAAYLIEAGGTPIACGFTRPSRDFPDALYLGWLAVAAGHRGAGLAGRVLAAAETEARVGGYAALTLDTGAPLTDLHRFFEDRGFRRVDTAGDIATFRKDGLG